MLGVHRPISKMDAQRDLLEPLDPTSFSTIRFAPSVRRAGDIVGHEPTADQCQEVA